MSFALFIGYVLFTYLRPFDTIAADLASYRPMLIMWTVAFMSASVRALANKEVGARPVHFALLGMLVISIALSKMANQSFSGAAPAVADFSTGAMLMALCMLNLTTLRRLQVTCVAITCSVVFLAALGVYSYYSGFMADVLVIRQVASENALLDSYEEPAGFGAPADDLSGGYLYRVRSLGFLNDPNDFGQTMVTVLPLLWWLYVPRRLWRNLLLVAGPMALLGFTIYLTHSRGALLGVAALGLVVVNKVIGPVRTLLLTVTLAAGVSILSFGGRELSTKEESAAQRIEAWTEGLAMLKSNPVFGVGYSNFEDHHYITAHNSFVLCFAELGLVGYFAWMGLIVLAYQGLKQGIRLAASGSAERAMAVPLQAALIAYLACAWFLSRTYSPGLYLLLALCVAAWYVVRKVHGPPPSAVHAEPLHWRMATIAAMVTSLLGVYVFVRM